MCGILGAFSKENINGSEVKRALDLQKSRGPDDEGYRDISKDKDYRGSDSASSLQKPDISEGSSNKWFGHRRLSITGGKDCHQPMSYKNISIIFEGEIYNYKDVKKELEEAGHSFKTNGDTEVFLHSFEEWSIECLKKFEGKWVASIYNSEEECLYCIRDHFGTKPLYYSQENGDFFFSSTISPILELKDEEISEDVQTKLDYLVKGRADHTERTFFENVSQLRPGHYLKYADENINIDRIPRKNIQTRDLKQLCTRSIKSKIPETDFTVTLSGGLDSSIVASLLSEDVSQVYSADIENGLYESSVYREKVAEQNNLEIKEVSISRKDLIDNVEESMPIQEEPTISLPAQAENILFKEISKSGKKVVVTGSGADELFLGYPIFIPEGIAGAFKKRKFSEFLRLLKEHKSNLHLKGILYTLSLILQSHPKDWIKKHIYSKNNLIENNGSLSSRKYPENLHKSIKQQIECFWYPTIKRQSDKNAGAYGLEIREGFQSQSLLNYVENHSPTENIKEGKTKKTLRENFKELLPKIVYDRDEKIGFIETDERAMTSEIKEEFLDKFRCEGFRSRSHINSDKVIEALEKDNIRFNKAYRLYSYEIWVRTFLD